MPICKNCKKPFPYKTIVEGKEVDLRRREYCLTCNPYGKRFFWRGKKVNSEGRNRKRKFICTECGREKENKSRNNVCSSCRSTKVKHRNRNKALSIKGNKCLICGYSKCIRSLDFHHINNSQKLFTLATCWERPWKLIEKELSKCVLLCKNCHGEYHDGLFCLIQESDVKS